MFNTDKEKAELEIKRLYKVFNYNRVDDKWNEANNHLIYNEVYFSDGVTDHTRKLLKLMNSYLSTFDPVFYQPIFEEDLIEMKKEGRVTKSQIIEQRNEWKTIMKEAISGKDRL